MAKHKPVSDVEAYLSEANEVALTAQSLGWKYLERDIKRYLETANSHWPKLDPSSKEFSELRLRTLACQMVLEMVNDYDTNRRKMEEFYLKSNFPEHYVALDLDQETPLLNDEEGDENVSA